MKSATLGEISDRSNGVIQTGPFGSQLHQSDYRSEGVPVVMPQDIVGNHISDEKIAYIDETLATQLGRHLLAQEDIVFPRRGEINKRAIICAEQVGYFCGTGCLKISIPPVEIYPKWLFYYLGLEHIVKWIEGNAVGAIMLNLNTNILRALPIDYPPLDEQGRIVECLSAYDDLIATNQRRIALLEDAARLLYREWFVHLRFPGHESVPMKDGVPEGWRKTPIVEQTSFLNRGITPKYDDTAKGWVINQKCIRDGRISMEPARRQSKDVNSDRLVRIGDVLINSTGAGTLGRVAQVRAPIEDCTVDTHVTIARPIDDRSSIYFGQALLNLEPIFSEMGKGATNQLELSRSDIGAVKIWQPPQHLHVEFHRLVGPMLEQAERFSVANLLLEKARDLLLPKLMSGQLDVSGIPLPEEVAA